MKTMPFILALIILDLSAGQILAQEDENENERENTAESRLLNRHQACEAELKNSQNERYPYNLMNANQMNLGDCEKIMIGALLNGSESLGEPDRKGTADKRAECISKGNYTLDFNDCQKVRNAYNAVIIAEQAMLTTQQVVVKESNVKQAKTITKAQEKGDTQAAAMQAIVDRNRQNRDLYNTQFATYSAAVGVLGGYLTAWQSNGIKKKCKTAPAAAIEKNIGIKDFGPENCLNLLEKNKNIFFSNDEAKGFFVTEAAKLISKAAIAKKNAGISEEIANKVEQTPQLKDDEAGMFDSCVLDPTLPECKSNGPRRLTSTGLAGAGASFAPLGQGQSFHSAPVGESFGEMGAATNLPTGDEQVAPMTDPFQDQAKMANDILNPARKAEVTPGSANAPASGVGGGGGGGGGGSASLGDDLKGQESEVNKEPEVNIGKEYGKYGQAKGAGGFQGVKTGKNDGNPFSALFNKEDAQKGGIEEDRSIASDVDAKSSELFQKISKRYGQVHADKRIESLNFDQ
jgi:hypothetical protein